MDDEKKTIKNESNIITDSSFESGYFFGSESNEEEATLLSEFGWNLPQPQQTHSMEFNSIDLQPQTQSILAGRSSLLPENNTTTYNSGSGSSTSIVDKSGEVSTSNPSLSSSSSDEQPEKSTGSDGKPPEKQNKGVRKKGQKRTRQQRFAFMTKSDVDHLEDGYRWRKYGQKAVKNSPYPRSYYRCTNSKCTVKKRVERSCEDPSIVITTYEGQHCHHTVSFLRGGVFSGDASFMGGLNPSATQIYAPSPVQYPTGNQLSISQLHQLQHELRPNRIPPEGISQNLGDEGLLGDMVPPGMRNK